MAARKRTARRTAVLGTIAMLIVLGTSAWRPHAQNLASPPARPVVDHTQNIGMAALGDRGATYHSLESRAFRTTTTFADAVSVAERQADGRIRSRLSGRDGHEIATLSVESALVFSAGGVSKRVARHQTLKPTLGWANDQVYAVADAITASLVWHDTLLRPADASAARPEPVELRTESSGGFEAHARRQRAAAPLTGDVFVSRILENGRPVGSSTWFVQDKVLAWSFPGLTEGSLSAKELEVIGGAWPFEPDLEWMNTQNLAFYEFHRLIRDKGRVAQREKGTVLGRIAEFLVPSLRADEPGCDNLHWLDNTIFRPCCDIHDQCYYAVGCEGWSWWWGSAYPYGWQCVACNSFAIGCFVNAAVRGPFSLYPW